MDNLFTQDSRLLAIRLPADSDIQQGDLLLHRIEAQEALDVDSHALFHCNAQCYSTNTFIELKEVLGQPVEISILQADASYRLVSGIVSAVSHEGSDGGMSRFNVSVVSAYSLLSQRINCRVFQDMTVPQIVEQIFQEHIAANPVFAKCLKFVNKTIKSYPKRSYSTQLYESDAHYIARILCDEGIVPMHLHGDGDLSSANTSDDSSAERTDPITHQFVLIDDNSTYPAGSDDTISFQAVDATSGEDSIFDLTATRQVTASNTAFASYEYKSMSTSTTNEGTWIQQGDAGSDVASTLEDYSPQTLYYGQGQSDLNRYTALRQQAKDASAKYWHGQSTVRNFAVGTKVKVTDHPVLDQGAAEDREFLLLNLSYTAINNFSKAELASIANISGTDHSGSSQDDNPYLNHFSAIRSSIPFVPAYTAALSRPVAKGMETAIVTGPTSEEIYTDSLGRICIQFHWQRTQDHPNGGADFDDKSSTWVRVAMPAAGGKFGQQMIPRVGQEVLIIFLHGDPDRPICIGVVHTGTLTPPTFSGVGSLPANKTLAGIKTKEYKGDGYNELLFDDTTGQLRAKLSSEFAKTQLNQGYLIHPRNEGKGEPRGEGFELTSDASGGIRTGRGLLLSAWARQQASGTQLSREEFNDLLNDCYTLFAQLGQYAAKNQGLDIDPKPQEKLKQDIQNWDNGSNTAPGKADGGQPVIGITAPAGISYATPLNILGYAGQHYDGVAQQHMQLTSGQRFNVNAGKGISMFSHQDGFKAISHHGNMQIQAQHDDVEVNASKNIKLTATEGQIAGIAAKEIVLMTSGGAYLKLSGANAEIGCPGTFTVKAAEHLWAGPASMTGDLPKFKDGDLGRTPQLIRPTDGKPVEGAQYKIKMGDGSVQEGKTDADGKTPKISTDRLKTLSMHFFNPKKDE